MPLLMTQGAVVTCPHGGTGTTTPTTQALTISGQTALVEGDTGTLACPLVSYPCAGYTLRSMGLNATTISERKAILATDMQQSYTGLPLTIQETQTVLQDNSSAGGGGGGGGGSGSGSGDGGGGSAAALPPELLDMTPPVVTLAGPPALVFDSTTQMPATLQAVFTLSGEHPRDWQLKLINPVLAQTVELTDGATPGAAVTPAGGGWSASPLTVSLTLTAVFMAGLGRTAADPHEFYLTASTRRGLQSYAVLKLTVT